MNFPKSLSIRLLSALILITLLAGCENKLTRSRWDMIKPGVDDKQTVKATLGKPQEKPFDDLWWYYKDDITVKIYFDKNGTVKAKKWINEKKGVFITEPKGWIEK